MKKNRLIKTYLLQTVLIVLSAEILLYENIGKFNSFNAIQKDFIIGNHLSIYILAILLSVFLIISVCGEFLLLPKNWLVENTNEMIAKKSVLELAVLFCYVSFCEEVFYRAVLQPLLGIVFTSVIFTLLHFRYFKKPLYLFNILVFSLIVGFFFLKTGKLLPVIIIHFCYNLGLALLRKYIVIAKSSHI